jgi:hypothetical protein
VEPTPADAVPNEVPLTGGNVGGATRVGATVRRPTGPWTPAVHALLGYLRDAGLDSIPAVLGMDERGREMLSFIPGRSIDVATEAVSDDVLAAAAAWLRRFHDIVRDYRPAGEVEWRHGRRTLGPDQIICHHDPGAYNWVIDGDRLAGVVDWDMAGPGEPIDDLAFMAWSAVPLFRPTDARTVARRLWLMSDAYGAFTGPDVLARAQERMRQACDRIADGQRRGDPGMLNLAKVGEPARTRGHLAELAERLPELTAALER